MSEEDSVTQTFNDIREWNEFGARLNVILEEIKERMGDAPIYVDGDGEFFVHADVSQRLSEAGNEGPLEFLRFMQRTASLNKANGISE